jgi:hypothetical protein
MAHLDKLRAIEMKALDVEPPAWREPEKPAVGRLGDVCARVVALGTKTPQALWCIAGWGIVAFEAVAGGAGVNEVLDLVGTPGGQGVKVIELQLPAHGRLGHPAVTASTAKGRPHGRPRLCQDCHLRRR